MDSFSPVSEGNITFNCVVQTALIQDTFYELQRVVLPLMLSDIISWFLFQVSVPLTDGLDPILMITDDATVAAWHNQGLPNDRMSIENAAILTTSERWPLMIDPQQQGIKWIRNRLGSELKVVQLGQKGWGSPDNCLLTIKVSCFNTPVRSNHKVPYLLLIVFSVQQLSGCYWKSCLLWWNRPDRKSARKYRPSPGAFVG